MSARPADAQGARTAARQGGGPPMSGTDDTVLQPEEQLRYARLLDLGTRVGLVLLVASFVLYLSGGVAPHVPLEQLPGLWHHPSARYIELTGMPTGWRWLGIVHRSDIAGLAGIAVLASCSLPALAALVPLYLRRGDRVHAALCVAVVLVIVLAASGLLAQGH